MRLPWAKGLVRPPRPEVTLEVDGVPAWLVRLLAGVMVAVCVMLGTGQVVVAVAAGAAVAVIAHPGTSAAIAALMAAIRLFDEPDLGATAALVLGVGVAFGCARLCADVPIRGVLEWRMLRRVARAWVITQAAAQALVAVAFVALGTVPAMSWLGVLALAVFGCGVIVAVRRVRRAE